MRSSGKEKKATRKMKITKNLRQEQDSADISDITNNNTNNNKNTRKRARVEVESNRGHAEDSDDDDDVKYKEEIEVATGLVGSFIDEDFIRL